MSSGPRRPPPSSVTQAPPQTEGHPRILGEDTEKTDPEVMLPPPRPVAGDEAQVGPPRLLPGMRMPSLGALDSLLADSEITEILVNDLRNVMVERNGKMIHSGLRIQSLEELNRIIRNILEVTGRILSVEQPYVDIMLPDGSRVNIVAPPITVGGPSLTIRRFPQKTMGIADLIRAGSLDNRMAQFLQGCILGKLNVLICGGTGTGKTTTLSALAQLIPASERIVVIEDTPEIRIPHANSVRLQTKPQMPSSPPITTRELVANSLRMRPDRILVGECRRAEAFDMLQAMNTGHEGSMTTIHANAPRDGLSRLETLCMLAGSDLPLIVVRKQVAESIDIIIQIRRFRDGSRKISSITELTGMEADIYTTQDIFRYEYNREQELKGQAAPLGRFLTTGLVPRASDRLLEAGIAFPPNFFV
jgi:pilus assembly protein CpaF